MSQLIKHKNTDNDCKVSNVLLSCILLIIVIFIMYKILLFIDDKYLNSLDSFISKREMRMNIYKENADYDPDDNMNNDNQLLRYLDR